MLDKKDITELKKVFATKDDLKKLEKRIDKRFVRNNEELLDYINTVTEGLRENISNKIDELGTRIEAVLGNHEFRIKRLEKVNPAN